MPKRRTFDQAAEVLNGSYKKTPDGCWEWVKQPSRRYPKLMLDGTTYPVHRLSFLVNVGPIPDGLCVCHRCDNTRCINPDHLFLGTHQQNMIDMALKDRGGARRRSKLTDEQVIEIRAKHRRGVPPSWLASDYGVSVGHIRSIVARRVKNGYPTRYHAG